MTAPVPNWSTVEPTAQRSRRACKIMSECVDALGKLRPRPSDKSLELVRREFVERAEALPASVALEAAATVSVLCDLRGQGWGIRSDDGKLWIACPQADRASVEERKAQVRAAHLIERDAQLRHPAIRRFVRQMERPRLVDREWRSIFSLMRDGRDLASAILASLAASPDDSCALANLVDPYVQVVASGLKCEYTGLLVADIWRYFRHTWNTVYQSTPGRKLFFLVRDRAAPCHPVIGIGALGSSIVQLRCRDQWIGWTPTALLGQLRAAPSARSARWLLGAVSDLLSDILTDDLIKAGVLRRRDLAKPTAQVVDRLMALARKERVRHHRFPARRSHKTNAGACDWAGLAKTPLFRAKRALALGELLEARLALQQAGLTQPTKRNLARALADRQAVAAISTVLRRVKSVSVGVKMMDITVCGAIAPYNVLLGGKLVGLLAASPAVTRVYQQRYRSAPSIIASSLRGRAIVRKPHLVLLGTTSLYDAATSQYNRLRMPASVLGNSEGTSLAYVPLGKTVGYGSFHFSRETMEVFEVLLGRRQKGRQVNSIFGEGVNPKLRKVRSALDAIGMPSDLLLQHGSPRLVFGVPLAVNFREILLGFEKHPRPIVPPTDAATSTIVEFWRTRWLAQRIRHPAIPQQVAQHSVVYPIHHGARVVLPVLSGEDGPLFALSEPVAHLDPTEDGPFEGFGSLLEGAPSQAAERLS